MCGLTQSDIIEALKAICNNEEEVQKRLRELEYYTNGYHFSQGRSEERVFKTQTALSYLQVRKLNYHLTLVLIIGHVVSQATRKARS